MTIHVIGAGLAGLAAAIALTEAGQDVVLYEGTDHAGGRCRSYDDAVLGRRIDNGNHLVFSGNHAINAHLKTIGAEDSFIGPASAQFPFIDVRNGRAWSLHMSEGRLPWWIFSSSRRVPNTRWTDYLALWRLAKAKPEETITDIVPPSHPLFESLIEPLAIAVLNAAPREGAAYLLRAVLAETLLGSGGKACHPRIARDGLSESLIDPAVAWLLARQVSIKWNHRLRRVDYLDDAVTGLQFGAQTIELSSTAKVILAVPGRIAADLIPGVEAPDDGSPILNLHYRLEAPPPALPGGLPFIGLVGSLAQWLFLRGDIASVTVSAADPVISDDPDHLAKRIWQEIAPILGHGRAAPIPIHRVVKEKMATFRQTPQSLSRRPGPKTHLVNLYLAGDWTDTGLPATIEGALRSGRNAAKSLLTTA